MRNFPDVVKKIARKEIRQSVNTSYPAIVVGVNSYQSEQTVNVQPLVHIVYDDGQHVRLPVIYDVPVILPSSGSSCGMTLPIKENNTVALVFAKNSLEEFLEQNEADFYTPKDKRYFSITDCYALPSLPSKRNNLSPHPDNLEIKFNDILFSLSPDGTIVLQNSAGTMTLSPSGLFTINGAQITPEGDFITASGISLNTHKHSAGAELIGNLGNPVTGKTDVPEA